jgi:hypothetical protein
MRRSVTTAIAVILVGVVALPAFGLGRREASAVCHRSRVGAAVETTWRLLYVGPPASEAHRAHGDGTPGGAVPGQPGWVFDSSCTPQHADEPVTNPTNPTTTTTTTTSTTTTTLAGTVAQCFDGAFGTYDLYVQVLDVLDGATFWSSTDGTCAGSTQDLVTVVDGAADRSAPAARCAEVLGGPPEQYYPLKLEPLFAGVPADWWLCP